MTAGWTEGKSNPGVDPFPSSATPDNYYTIVIIVIIVHSSACRLSAVRLCVCVCVCVCVALFSLD